MRGVAAWEAGRAEITNFTRSREDPMREGQFFAMALGPRRWSRFSTKAILGDGHRPPGGPGWQASALATWAGMDCLTGARISRGRRPVELGDRRRLPLEWAAFQGGWIFGKDGGSLLILAENYNRPATGTTKTQSAQRRSKSNSRAVSG